MKSRSRAPAILILLLVTRFAAGGSQAQQAETREPANPSVLTCSPAPCVLPPTQASEGGSIVTDPLIVTNPTNQKDLLSGSFDANCSPAFSGFHLSTDGGSTWGLVECAPGIHDSVYVYWPYDGFVGYDLSGAAYAAAEYGDSEGVGYGFVAVQKSAHGTQWGKPVIALRDQSLSFAWLASLVVDTSPSSPWVNSVYVSAVMVLGPNRSENQVTVAQSADGGATWSQAAVDPVQKDPEVDRYERMAVGKDGTVYITWLRCRGTGQSDLCPFHMMFSNSTDGGKTWSAPLRIATVKMPQYWELPNTSPGIGVSNYPVIVADNSSGPYSGNLYVAMYTWTGTYLRVQVIRSTDGGATWSQPVHLAPKSDTHDQFFPTISISPAGRVAVSWLDRRNDPANHDYQAFAAFSDDGGRTFGTNWQLTTAFSDPDVNGDYNWMGDYTGNSWKGDSTFIAAWMDSSNGIDMQEVVGGVRLK